MLKPVVRLVAFTPKPYDLAVASARTCYSPKAVLPAEVTEGQRERVGPAVWAGGHHTTFQHATFTFAIENVSRQFVWSFLHSHPYYNSDQSSQRYVAMGEAKAVVPDLEGEASRAYSDAVASAWEAYARLSAGLKEKNRALMAAIGKVKGQSGKHADLEAERKSIEMARYVLPVSACTSLVHTVSSLVLMRYARMVEACDCPTEAKTVVSEMLAEAAKADPEFARFVSVKPLPRDKALPGFARADADSGFAREFDARLEGHLSKLVSFDPGAEAAVADAVRETLGKTRAGLGDGEAIELAVNPSKNPALQDTLNVMQHSPVSRALNLVSYRFMKRISHACDSQDQRHRTTPAARPLLTLTHAGKPDFITPGVIASDAGLKKTYDDAMGALWEAKNRLIELGVPDEFAVYLLPNATALRFSETGRVIDLMHKWRMRTCFNAQEEIFDVSMDELKQAKEVHPRLAGYIGPPCYFRQGMKEGGETPCPEGARWCGIEVWRNFPKVKRPF
ncbi:MAG: FAD-dependent thymidylate synthase [Candidatus ainarchaeum sp.]|nr:FAD-dependent thymidylate synthase [Candidatus ainarchaeum sp.]